MRGRTNAVASAAAEPKYWTTTILIDQTITDPATMVTKVYDDGGIAMIRANSHRYVCQMVDGVLNARQLQDNNGTLYLDGTPADLTGGEGDVFMKLPNFYYRMQEDSVDRYYITFVYGEPPTDQVFKKWDDCEFIGVYEAYVADKKVYSISGVRAAEGAAQNSYNIFSSNRGEGYGTVTWKHHSIMAFLFFAWYLHTDSQAICGSGASSYVAKNGDTNLLGMEDTVAGVNGDNQSTNFWGLENWWGDRGEFIGNAAFKSAGVMTVTERDGSTRDITLTTSTGWVSSLTIGGELDAAPKKIGASATTGCCDSLSSRSSNYKVVRGGYKSVSDSGITCLKGESGSASDAGSRLCYYGPYNII